MTIKPIVYLLIINSFFTICANLTYGEEEVLVFHDSTTVYVLSTSPDGEPIRKELIDNVDAFRVNRNGYFTMRDRNHGNGAWYKGRISSSFTVTKQALPSIPPDVTSVTISQDGKLTAWSPPIQSPMKSELTIEEHAGYESKVLRKIYVDGLIPAFSFSPNSDLLAFFYGPPEAAHNDGFSLMLLDLKNPEKPPVEIAPPSLPTRLAPGRMNPAWSPDGKYILIEARYTGEDIFSSSRYIVSTDGLTLVPSPAGKLGHEGKYIRRLEQIGDAGSNEFIITEIKVSSPKEKIYIGDKLKIGNNHTKTSLSTSDQKIAYIENKEVFIYDTIKKTTVSYGTSHNNILNVQEFFWIFPRD